MKDLLNKRVWLLIEEATKLGFNSKAFKQMIFARGGDSLATIEAILSGKKILDGFSDLQKANRLEMSIEALVLYSEFTPLFSKKAKEQATKRLKGIDPKKSWKPLPLPLGKSL